MRGWLVRHAFVALALVGMFALGGSVVLAAIPNTNGSVYACYNKTAGAMRVINYPTMRCTSSEKMIALASATVTSRHVAGNYRASFGSDITAMVLFEVNAAPNGAVRSGYYTFDGMTGSDWAGYRDQGTVDTVRFFTAASGAPAAEFTGTDCVLAAAPAAASPAKVGSCGHYRLIVTDGASVGLADTACAGQAEVTDPNNPMYCPWVSKVETGDIRIYSGW